ncbi:MAG TPA: nuclear transport factor 2 family protein [Vicinamibacteria bacterium]|nr:nuclear transport factor 2 family protein [Vicinamibacteria bacterium]
MKWPVAALLALAPVVFAESNAELKEQVRQTEIAFAKTMADRDHAAFTSFLADDTLFFGRTVQRGKGAVAQAWKRFYEDPQAPFSWAPDTVEVLDSGALGLSSGPVFDPTGARVGTFTSIWRREQDGRWRVIFDKGCDCGEAPPPAKPQS